LSCAMECGETRARLDRQLVEGEVPGAEREGLCEGRRPAVFAVAGQRVNEVEADAPKAPLRNLQRCKALARRVRPAEESERLVVEALKPERQAVDPGMSEIGEAIGFDRIWVGFERDLDAWSGPPVPDCGVDHGLDRA